VSSSNYFKFILICLVLGLGWTSHAHANAQKEKRDLSIYIIGPGISKHLRTSYTEFNEFHPGIGCEFKLNFNRWILGFHGYYMHKDSLNHEASWTGLTAGYRFGGKNKLWCEPFIMIGGIKKREYRAGKFSPFALPVFSIGYKWLGFNLGYIPEIPEVTNPILIFQIKVRIR
jgi:hypothetical protein